MTRRLNIVMRFIQLCSALVIFAQLKADNQTAVGELVKNESRERRNEWPWLASLYHIEKQTFFCGGTIISANHVLTAANCIKPKGENFTRRADEMVAFLGKYNFTYTHERGSEVFYPTEILIHPDWNVTSCRYDADIAILYSEDSVRLKNRVFPIKLWNQNVATDDSGTIVGWSRSASMNSDAYDDVELKIVPSLKCYEDNHYFALFSSQRTFCAGGEAAGPCKGTTGKIRKFSNNLKYF